MPTVDVLSEVLTLTEAQDTFYVARSTLLYHMERGKIRYRKSGGVILLERQSLVTLWGKPRQNSVNSVVHATYVRR